MILQHYCTQARKADKSREKDEQEDTREKLDAEFGDLMGLLQTRPTRANGTDKVRPQMDEYDRMTKVYLYYLIAVLCVNCRVLLRIMMCGVPMLLLTARRYAVIYAT
jgi:hypothetical protein